jgi:Mg-chelatase subunit ChlI
MTYDHLPTSQFRFIVDPTSSISCSRCPSCLVFTAYKEGKTPEVMQIRIPMVEVPLGTTEDRICGTIDIEKALAEGIKAYDPGQGWC